MVSSSSAFTGQQALQPLPEVERRYVDDYPLEPMLVKEGIPVLKVTKVCVCVCVFF